MRASYRLAAAVLGLYFCVVACGAAPQERKSWRDPEPGVFETGPYALADGEGGVLVAAKADVPGPPTLVWRWVLPDGAGASDWQETAFERSDDLWVARVIGEEGRHRIAYRVATELGSSSEHEMQLGRAEDETFRFAAFGDTRTNHRIHRSVVEALAAEEFDFVVHTGDMVERGGVQESWDRFFQIERPLLREAPIVPAVGNHDLGARDYYSRYFLQEAWTGGRRYFSLDWGNLRLLGLDIGIEGRSGSDQYEFAERALAEGAERGMLLVIFLHYPPYSSGKHGSHMGAREMVVPLSKRYGVELVLAGHDHNYERTIPMEGTVYVVSGSAGAPIRPVVPKAFSAHARTEPHYVLIDVEGDSMILRAVNLQGDTFDTHVIGSVPPSP